MSKLNPIKQVLQAAALTALLSLGVAQAMPGHHAHGAGGPGWGGGRHAEHMLELVDASEAQRSQIHEIMKKAGEDLKPQRQALRELHRSGRALLAAPSIDAAALEAQRRQGLALHEQISKRMSEALIAAANVLTPEQRAKLGERMAKREARQAERMKQHGAHHGGHRGQP